MNDVGMDAIYGKVEAELGRELSYHAQEIFYLKCHDFEFAYRAFRRNV